MLGVEALARGGEKDHLPYAAIATANLFWSMTPLFVRAIATNSTTLAMYRTSLAIPISLLVVRLAHAPFGRDVLRKTAVPGMLFGVSILFSFVSFRWTSIANATLIPSAQPVLMFLVAGRMFGEQVRLRTVLLGAASLTGVVLVMTGAGAGGDSSLRGDLFAVANLFCFAVYFLAMKRARTVGTPAISLLAGVMIWATVAVVPYALLAADDLTLAKGTDWVWLLTLILLPGLLGHGLMNWAQRWVDVTVSSLMNLSQPVLAAAMAWVVYGQSLRVVQIVGAVVVLGSSGAILASQRVPPVVEGLG